VADAPAAPAAVIWTRSYISRIWSLHPDIENIVKKIRSETRRIYNLCAKAEAGLVGMDLQNRIPGL
jgi:hypothetical protein